MFWLMEPLDLQTTFPYEVNVDNHYTESVWDIKAVPGTVISHSGADMETFLPLVTHAGGSLLSLRRPFDRKQFPVTAGGSR